MDGSVQRTARILGEMTERGLICMELNPGVLRDTSRRWVGAPLIPLPKGKGGINFNP